LALPIRVCVLPAIIANHGHVSSSQLVLPDSDQARSGPSKPFKFEDSFDAGSICRWLPDK
jgi:hypothetical protein